MYWIMYLTYCIILLGFIVWMDFTHHKSIPKKKDILIHIVLSFTPLLNIIMAILLIYTFIKRRG